MKPILTPDFKLPEDGFVQLAPLGEFPVTVRDAQGRERRLVQVVDAASVQAQCNRFAAAAREPGFAGVLVDFDHFSLDTRAPSRAAGWITEVANRGAAGMWGKVRWSASGLPAVTGGDYRYLSNVYDERDCETLGANRVRPLQLERAAITNDPNMAGIRPISNRTTGGDAPGSTEGNMQGPCSPACLKALGLPETADEAACLAAIQALKDQATSAKGDMAAMKNRAETAEQKVLAAEQAALAAQVEQDLVQYAPVIQDREAVKAQLLANREGGLKLLKSLKPAAPGAKLPNRRDNPLPTGDGAGDEAAAAADQRAAKIRNRAAELRREQGVTFQRAWDLAEAEVGG